MVTTRNGGFKEMPRKRPRISKPHEQTRLKRLAGAVFDRCRRTPGEHDRDKILSQSCDSVSDHV